MIRNIRWLIYSVAFILTLFPTLAAFYATQGIVESAVHLGFNQNISMELEKASHRLKELAKLDPKEKEKYRKEFNELQDMRIAYETLFKSSSNLNSAYMQIFFLISGFALSLALLLAWWLNRRIIQSHDSAVSQMEKAKERTIYLEQSESWRLFAQKLVHEIKNPLTPVQVMVGRMPQKYTSSHPEPSPEFLQVLTETKAIVNEEIEKVNTWVESFSQYARMPAPKLQPVHMGDLLDSFHRQYKDFWPNLTLELKKGDSAIAKCDCDETLVKQALFNLAKNSVEAAKGNQVHLTMEVGASLEQSCFIKVSDNGPGIPPSMVKHLFRPYMSSKGDRGMGLGLAISNKILVEHGGSLEYLPSTSGCTFILQFSSSKEKTS